MPVVVANVAVRRVNLPSGDLVRLLAIWSVAFWFVGESTGNLYVNSRPKFEANMRIYFMLCYNVLASVEGVPVTVSF